MQAPVAAMPRAAYLHVPFCARRCGYCNFTVVAGRDDLANAYLHALELELAALEFPRPVATLFIGGGTPTHLAPPQLERLLTLARRWFPPLNASATRDPSATRGGNPQAPSTARAYDEFSIEANPLDLTSERVDVLRRQRVTRVSLGAQSFSPRKLAILERDHHADAIARAVDAARRFARGVSLDLIFAVPGETQAEWEADLAAALALPIDHISAYGLTFERGTAFWARRLKGQLREVDEELQRILYCQAIDVLTAAGLEHYEVSNFARPGHRCAHNEGYWAAEEYYAAGPGAARYIAGRREVNHRSTTTWLQRLMAGRSPVAESEVLSPEDRAREALMLGLRRRQGVEAVAFETRFGHAPEKLLGASLHTLMEQGLLEVCVGPDSLSRQVRLTRAGLLVYDSVCAEFLRA